MTSTLTASADSPKIKRIAIVAPSAQTLLPLRGLLIRDILERRHRIICLAPDFTQMVIDELAEMGIECAGYNVEPSRLAIGPARLAIGPARLAIGNDIKMLRALTQSLKEWRPHVALAYGGVSAILGAIAAKQAKTANIVAMFSGLAGVVSSRETSPGKAATKAGAAPRHDLNDSHLSRSMHVLRWRALRSMDALVLHNESDKRLLQQMNLLPRKLPVHVTRGSGVDLGHFKEQPLPALDGGLHFLMVSQLSPAKGVAEFCEAAALVKPRAPNAKFTLLGGAPGPSDKALPEDDLARYKADGFVEFADWASDVRGHLKAAHVFVLPSRFGEGLSKTTLEALAVGRPVIASDIPGCRELIDERVNGCLVRPGDIESLVEAMESFLRRPDLIPSMAQASRAKAERWYNVEDVNRQMLDILAID